MSDSGNQKLAFLVVCSQEAITAQVILEHMGARSEAYGCEICSSTDEALEHKELSNFDVVFVDQSALHLSPDTVQNPHLMQNESFLQLCQTLPVVVVCRSDAELLAARLIILGALLRWPPVDGCFS